MKKQLLIFLTILLGIHAFSELKYIEIGTKQNLPMIQIKTVEDFEAIIKTYDISLIFLQSDSLSKLGSSNSSEAFVIAENTYFLFPLEGYKTLADYKKGKSEGYKNSSDFEKAKQLGIENGEFFYYCERNSFTKLEDAEDAYKNGFVLYESFRKRTVPENLFPKAPAQNQKILIEGNPKNKESEAYYEAKKLGYVNYVDYKEYLDYTTRGFNTKDESILAKSKGFSQAEEFKTATAAGFVDKDEYKAAEKLGLTTKSDFIKYNEITTSINNIVENQRLNKKDSAIYYFIQNLQKGDYALSALSKSLIKDYDFYSTELKNSLDLYINDIKSKREYDQKLQDRKKKNNILNIPNFFTENELRIFFNLVSDPQLGSYSSQTEIFKKN